MLLENNLKQLGRKNKYLHYIIFFFFFQKKLVGAKKPASQVEVTVECFVN